VTSWQEERRNAILAERAKEHERYAAERLAKVNAICALACKYGMSYGRYIAERSKIMDEENKAVTTNEEAPRKHGIREPLPPEKVERAREMLAEGAKISDIVAETLVSRATIGRIKNGTYGVKQPKKVPAAVAAETSGQRTDGILHELISRAVETLRDTQGDTPDDCALVGKALGLLTAAEMILGDGV
jgi:hypothetical protein